MNLNGINDSTKTYNTYGSSGTTTSAKPTESKEAKETAAESGVVYEKSSEGTAKASGKYVQDTNLVAKLQADTEARVANLRSIVEKLISGQGNALGQADDIWSFLRKGDFTVDAATKAQAEADIAEDGYWGVNQTSDRILDFAKALTGGDPSKIEEMREAFKKGFESATKTWGDTLPDISQKTYEATMKKFDEWAAENQSN
ncbi:MAG: hypothetical protein K5662_04370 [Lachnospiraceae bacterium]|nr:hypothetical protein [Lachnospiraceae bacterium]